MKTLRLRICLPVAALFLTVVPARLVTADYTASLAIGFSGVKAAAPRISVQSWYTVPIQSSTYRVDAGILPGGRAESIPEPAPLFLFSCITGLFLWSRRTIRCQTPSSLNY